MNKQLNDEGLDLLFRKARTHNAWLDKPVGDDVLRQLYDLMKWGPTSANGSTSTGTAIADGGGSPSIAR